MKNDLRSLHVGEKVMIGTVSHHRLDSGNTRWCEAEIKKIGRDYLYVSLHGWDSSGYRRDTGAAQGGGGKARTLAFHEYATTVLDPLRARWRDLYDKRGLAIRSIDEKLSAEDLSTLLAILEPALKST